MNNSDNDGLAFIEFWISPNQTDYEVFDQPQVEQNDTIWREKVDDFGEVEPTILFLLPLLPSFPVPSRPPFDFLDGDSGWTRA